MPVFDDDIAHIRATPEGTTQWSSGPGGLTFDPECPRCWMEEWQAIQQRMEMLEKVKDAAQALFSSAFLGNSLMELKGTLVAQDNARKQGEGK